ATLAYAVHQRKIRVALDDRQARRLAQRLSLPIVGLVGILLQAKQAGLLHTVQPHLEAARSKGFYLHPLTYQQALRLAGEASAACRRTATPPSVGRGLAVPRPAPSHSFPPPTASAKRLGRPCSPRRRVSPLPTLVLPSRTSHSHYY